MSKLLISYINKLAEATITCSSEHPSFPCENVVHRWYKKTWRSKYGAGSDWGLFRITTANQNIYFNEGAGNLTATLTPGDYDITSLLVEIKTQMDAAGATYTPTFDETTMKWSIAITAGTFKLLLSNQTDAAWDVLGYTGAVDTALAASHTADEIRIHTSEFLYIDLGATETLRVNVLKNHNLQSTAIITVRYYSDAFVTLVDSEVLTWHASQIGARTAQSYRYIAYEISDPSNPDGFIEIGLAWGGDSVVPHYGFNPEHTRDPEDPSTESESDDGQLSTIQRTRYDNWTYSFDAVKPTDVPAMDAIFEEIGKTRPCILVEAPPTLGDIGEDFKYARFTGWSWTHITGEYYSFEVEVKGER